MKTPALTTLALGFAFLACGSSSTPDGGPNAVTSAADYFGLNPGFCYEFAADGGTTTVGLEINTLQNPPGVAVVRTRQGQIEHQDLLVFDGGTAFLAEQDIYDAGLSQRLYQQPLFYLVSPLAAGLQTTSQSAYTEGSGSGTESLTVNVVESQPWTGYAADAGSLEYRLTFSSIANGEAAVNNEAWVVPGLGFVDLLLPDTGALLQPVFHYQLTNVHPYNSADGGCGEGL